MNGGNLGDSAEPVIFDGHNDVLLRLYRAGGVSAAPSFLAGRDGAIDLPKARAGGFAGGFFAVYVPSPLDMAARNAAMAGDSYDLPLPTPIPWEDAFPVALTQTAILFELERLGALCVCRTVSDLRAAMDSGKIAAILHLEGAEPIDADFNSLDVLYQAGLRSIGPVWSRNNDFAHGVPFKFPSDGNIGPGLTPLGVELVKRCNTMGILVDLSHMNAAGFWDVAEHSTKPLVATHSNAHAICPHSRNLDDAQLAAIRDSDGLVGLNFAVAFLRKDGRKLDDVPIEQMLRHLDHLINILGEDRVGLGSDYDGTITPKEVTTVQDLPKLRQAMAAHGYGDALIAKLCHQNWLRVLEKTWTPDPT